MSDFLEIRRLDTSHREDARAFLAQSPRDNLFLLDLIADLGRPAPVRQPASQALGIFQGRRLAGVAALRPALSLDAGADDAVVDAVSPYLAAAGPGLLKCDVPVADRLWNTLERLGRRSLVDRMETAYWMEPDWLCLREAPPGSLVRGAGPSDLEALVFAARASLREEDRPDPFEGDPEGFRQWVAGRVSRALLVELAGMVRFVGYADVRRTEGWLLQGVYTWPGERRLGLAAAGVSALCRLAFETGAGHVQLAVVEGNRPAEALYEALGFRRYGRLRTILFA